MKTHLSKTVLSICMALAFILSACGAGEPPVTPTAVNTNTPLPPTLTPTATLTPTNTPVPTNTPTPTITPNLAATQQYENLSAWVQRFHEEGLLPSVDGQYYPLADYSNSFAKSGYYNWDFQEDIQPANFIIQARVTLVNATSENLFKSACGFVFDDFFSNHGVFFALDGNASYRTEGMDRGSKYLDATLLEKPEGVQLTLILYNKALLFYVNDQLALSGITVYGGPFSLGPSVLSGTSEGFGTRCDFTEMSVWEIK